MLYGLCDNAGPYMDNTGCEAWDSTATSIICCDDTEADTWLYATILVGACTFFSFLCCVFQVLIATGVFEKEMFAIALPVLLFFCWATAGGAVAMFVISQSFDASNFNSFSKGICGANSTRNQNGGFGSFAIILTFLINFTLQWAITTPACCGTMMRRCEVCVDDDGFAK